MKIDEIFFKNLKSVIKGLVQVESKCSLYGEAPKKRLKTVAKRKLVDQTYKTFCTTSIEGLLQVAIVTVSISYWLKMD